MSIVNIKTSKPAENFYENSFQQNGEYTWKQKQKKFFWEGPFAASFLRLELKRRCKEDYVKVGKSKIGIGLQDS